LRRALVLLAVLALPAAAQPLKPWSGGSTPGLELAAPAGKLLRLAD
jgi:hypothetical protein